MDAGLPADRADPDVALVLRSYEAFARGDIDEACAPLHPDVEWIEPDEFPGGGHHDGAAAATKYLRTSRATWARVTSERISYRRGGQIVVVHHVFGRLVDGAALDVTVADVFTVRDNQVVRMQAYADPAQALALDS